jgi:hypothetical protein
VIRGTIYAYTVTLLRVSDELATMEKETLAEDSSLKEGGADVGELQEILNEAQLTHSNIRLSRVHKPGAQGEKYTSYGDLHSADNPVKLVEQRMVE